MLVQAILNDSESPSSWWMRRVMSFSILARLMVVFLFLETQSWTTELACVT
jgi:hypothetical protein